MTTGYFTVGREAGQGPLFSIIGYGAITAEIVRCLADYDQLDTLAGVLVRPARAAAARREAAGRFPIVAEIDALLDCGARTVAECAGHGALQEYGAAVLARGADLVVSSVGALADERLAAQLEQAAAGAARVLIPSGAVAGIDGLLAARSAGLSRVCYRSIKPPAAWRGTPGEDRLRDAPSTGPVVLFSGTAREAARLYPQNANVGATVGFAGLGLDHTEVELIADPAAAAPVGIIEAEGAFGTFRFEILAHASPRNPKTSVLTAHSIIRAAQMGVCFTLPAASARR